MTVSAPAPHAPLRDVVIVGGGTAGWMVAAAASRYLNDGQRRITLVESDAIGTVGVGEATIPPILDFNSYLGIEEADFVRATSATFKLGIEFAGWRREGLSYIHPFGSFGHDFQGVAFHHIWNKFRALPHVGAYTDYSMSANAAYAGRFLPPHRDPRGPLGQLAYAYHFDAGLYAAFLRKYAEAGGVQRIEGRISGIERDGSTGHVRELVLADGQRVSGELFLDCSGFRSLLLGDSMEVPFRDWSHWLPCDRAVAVPCARVDPLLPFTRSTARKAGWQWRIPLQHRTGNGHVYASAFMRDEEAEAILLANLDAPPSADPRLLRFTAGVRERLWHGNVVGIGLAGGFLEPLESTSIHLIQKGISTLFGLFPSRAITSIERDEYNRIMRDQFDYIRDFIILHYHATERTGDPMWDHVRTMAIPDSLASKLELFREKGRLIQYRDDLFAIPSWSAVLLGQGIDPVGWDPILDALDNDRLTQALGKLREGYQRQTAALPAHAEYIQSQIAGKGRLAS